MVPVSIVSGSEPEVGTFTESKMGDVPKSYLQGRGGWLAVCDGCSSAKHGKRRGKSFPYPLPKNEKQLKI
jgi:hypothetical protein